jgi:tetratricopeptide (TPR) repeat protein
MLARRVACAPDSSSIHFACPTTAPPFTNMAATSIAATESAASNENNENESFGSTVAETGKTGVVPASSNGTSYPASTLKEPPDHAAAAKCISAAGGGSIPTYQSSKTSSCYQNAKALLNAGEFEKALETLMESMDWTRSQLANLVDDVESIDLHDSLAPLHYLFGTTLLYNIEESSDDNQQMTETIETGEDEEDPERDVNASFENGNNEEEDEEPVENDENCIDDMQNAWDHLDTARIILERMLEQNSAGVDDSELRDDLAQVLLRQGDSQRYSGVLESAVESYSSCLGHLTSGEAGSDRYTRKIADVHCNLGVVYFNLVLKESDEEPEDGQETSEQKRNFYRQQGYIHYYECAKSLAGIVAELSGSIDPKDLFCRAESLPNFKTTGEDEDETGMSGKVHPKLICIQLRQLLGLVRELSVPDCSKEQALACIDILEDVLETVEEAENAEKGVAEATAMKDEISAMAQGQASENDGATSVGFAAVDVAQAASQPITMLVAKKKKRDIDAEGEDAKLPAKDSSSKRIRSSE